MGEVLNTSQWQMTSYGRGEYKIIRGGRAENQTRRDQIVEEMRTWRY